MSNSTRVLTFPSDKDVGVLSQWNLEKNRWEKIGAAQGEITVPLKAKLLLRVLDPSTPKGFWRGPLTFLESLEPNALAKLDLSRVTDYHETPDEGKGYFAPIARQTGLVGLDVSSKQLEYIDESVRLKIKDLRLDAGDDDTLIDLVSKMHALTTFTCTRCGFTSDGIAALESLTNLTHLTMVNSRCEIEEWALKKLNKGLEKLVADDIRVGDFSFLREFPELSIVGALDSGWLNDDGLKELSHCKKISTLRLSNCYPITDEGFKYLSEFTELETLQADGTGVTDAGLIALQHATRLQTLYLSKTKVQGDGLRYLEKLPQLDELILTVCKLNQSGIESIAKIPTLTKLRLDESDLSQCSLVALANSRSLTHLYLFNATMSDDIEELRRQLPKCEIAGPKHSPVYG